MADSEERRAVFITALAQLVLTVACAGVAALFDSPFVGISVFWGGLVALTNVALLAWRLFYGDRPMFNAEQHLRLMYRSSMERFFVVAALLVIGLLGLKLNPLAMLLGFLVGQVILVAVPILRGIKVK